MPVITITKSDLEKAAPWPEGWQKATLVEVKEEPSKGKDSVNLKPIFEWGWKADGTRVEGRTASEYACLINNKNTAMFLKSILPLLKALVGKDITEETKMELNDYLGTELYIEITKETYNGQLVDKITGFASKANVPF